LRASSCLSKNGKTACRVGEADHEVADADGGSVGEIFIQIPSEAKKMANNPSSAMIRKIDLTTGTKRNSER
jgi:hypothetical protein